MDIRLKIVRNALLKHNYFEDDSSLKILNTVTDLSSIIITIEKNFNVKQFDFQYDSKKKKFIRLNNFENSNHFTVFTRCRLCSTPCFKSEYSTIEFLKLCRNVFEPICIKSA